MSPNEATNKLDVDFPVVNTSVQSVYLGVRRLLQSREDVTITLQLDYSGIQVEAGDVIRVKNNVYGWDVLNSGKGKLFRVANVAEEKYQDGSLGVRITAFEYNDTVYADHALTAFQPDPNTGLANPNIMDTPVAPRLYLENENTVDQLTITATVPNVGLFTSLNINYGVTSNTEQHIFYSTTNTGDGEPLTGDIVATDTIIGNEYSILTLGTTDWTTAGAEKIDLSTAPAVGGFLTSNIQYIIETAGTTDWTSVGATSNTAGEIFIANNLGAGTGTALKTDFVANSVPTGDGTAASIVNFSMTDLPDNDYYWSTTARNQTQGVTGPSSNVVSWRAGVSNAQFGQVVNCFSTGNVITHDATDNVFVGGTLILAGGPGELAANSYVTLKTSNTEFEVDTAPTVALANTVLNIFGTTGELGGNNQSGGVTGNNIQNNSINFNNLGIGTGGELIVSEYYYTVAEPATNVVNPPVQWNQSALVSGANLVAEEALGTFQQPKYLTPSGTGNVASNQIYPYWSGTSTTANGYLQNSTSIFNPADATQFLSLAGVGGGPSGPGPWWPIEYSSFVFNGQPYNIPASDSLGINYKAQFVANNDTQIQLSRFIKFRSSDFNMSFQTDDHLLTIDLKANEPKYFDLSYIASGTDVVNGAGMCMRLLKDTSNVYVMTGRFEVKDVKG
jgi:hypothetical protein